MADLNVINLFDLSYDQINAMKKKDLVNHIENLKGKVTVDATIKKLCDEISQLSTSVNNLMTENGKIKVIDICKESGIELNPYDIEACHRLPSGRVNTSNSKRVIVKFVNMKHSEAMLRLKKLINSRSNVYITNSLCPYYRFLWGKCKDLQRKALINEAFCLGAVDTIKVRENGPPIKIFHENDLLVYQEMTSAVPEI